MTARITSTADVAGTPAERPSHFALQLRPAGRESDLGVRVRGRTEPPEPLHVLVTSVSSDSHTWNLVFLQLLLEDLGHKVTNLGACTPDDEILGAARALEPDLLVV